MNFTIEAIFHDPIDKVKTLKINLEEFVEHPNNVYEFIKEEFGISENGMFCVKFKNKGHAIIDLFVGDEIDHFIFDIIKEFYLNRIDLDAYTAYLTVTGEESFKDFFDAYYGQYSSHGEFANDYINNAYDIDDFILKHIDWSKLGNSLMIDFFEKDGYYFKNNQNENSKQNL